MDLNSVMMETQITVLIDDWHFHENHVELSIIHHVIIHQLQVHDGNWLIFQKNESGSIQHSAGTDDCKKALHIVDVVAHCWHCHEIWFQLSVWFIVIHGLHWRRVENTVSQLIIFHVIHIKVGIAPSNQLPHNAVHTRHCHDAYVLQLTQPHTFQVHSGLSIVFCTMISDQEIVFAFWAITFCQIGLNDCAITRIDQTTRNSFFVRFIFFAKIILYASIY